MTTVHVNNAAYHVGVLDQSMPSVYSQIFLCLLYLNCNQIVANGSVSCISSFYI